MELLKLTQADKQLLIDLESKVNESNSNFILLPIGLIRHFYILYYLCKKDYEKVSFYCQKDINDTTIIKVIRSYIKQNVKFIRQNSIKFRL